MRGGKRAVLQLIGAVSLATAACATAQAPASALPVAAAEADVERLVSDLEHDLARARARAPEPAVPRALTAPPAAVRTISRDLLFATMAMPVQDLRPRDISDTWGAPRDGGERKHRGIDLFAPRGTQIVAVADGVIEFIGLYPKGGRCVWLSTGQGVFFYYAHMDRWAAGIYEGMEVRKGDVLGYVGNTGNAITTPPHLHFGIYEGDEALNPYPILRGAGRTSEPVLTGGFVGGS